MVYASDNDGRERVAVIGLGGSGLTTVKNMLERGFQVTGFERNDTVGGVWQRKDDKIDQTSVLKTTRANSSKQFHAFSDFPFPDDVPVYPTAQDNANYLVSYAHHFNLFPHLRLGTKVEHIAPTSAAARPTWKINYSDKNGDHEEIFDRVVLTTGIINKLWKPSFHGQEDFAGQIIYSREYKGNAGFEGKKVLVVGNANTACDICVDLADVADVTMSHRNGFYVIKRLAYNEPYDRILTRRGVAIGHVLFKNMPNVTSKLIGKGLRKVMKSQFGDLDPKWNLLPAPPLENALITISDGIIPAMQSGKVKSIGGLKSFKKDSVITADGEIDVDVVIFATSAYYDFSVLAPEADPTNFDHHEWDAEPNANGQGFPRLYRNLLSTKYPDSLAFIQACKGITFSVFLSSDLESSAIAALWRGDHPMPSKEEMDKWCDATYQRNLKRIRRHRVQQVDCEPAEQERWLNHIGNNGVNEYLGSTNFSGKAWKWYFGHKELYKLCMDGVYSPHIYRLFDTTEENGGRGRKLWTGAEEAIYKANGKVMDGSKTAGKV